MKKIIIRSILLLNVLFVLFVKADDQKVAVDHDTEEEIDQLLVLGQRVPLKTETEEHTKKLLDVPGMGNDPLAAIYTLPGVVQIPYSIVEGTNGPGIRGSSFEDNAYYIDFMPAGFVFHTFLGNSVFNENLVQKFDLKPAAFGSQYGEAIGGVIDVTLRDPRNQEFSGIFDWSMLQTGLTLESGVTSNSAFYASYQESLLHMFLDEGEDEDDPGLVINNVPRSHNYQAKYQWLLSEHQRLTFGFNGANEFAAVTIGEDSEDGRADPDSIGDAHIDVNYSSQGVLWQIFNAEHSNINVSYSQLDKLREFAYGDGQYEISNVKEDFFRIYYQVFYADKHDLTYGLEYRQYQFNYDFDLIPYYCTNHERDCNEQRGERLDGVVGFTQKSKVAYITDFWRLTDRLNLQLGLRLENKDYSDESITMPRISLSWRVSKKLTFNVKSGKYARSAEDEFSVNLLGNPNLKSPLSNHYLFEVHYQLNDLWLVGADLYYKKMSRLPLSLEQSTPDYGGSYSNDLSGEAQGIELIVEKERKTTDGWYGWASLSWSKSSRTNDLTGRSEEYYLDTPWVFNLAVHNDSESGWAFGLVYTVRSGQRYTPIIGIQENPYHQGNFLPVYGELNSKRLPVYQRLDLKAEYNFQAWQKDAAWTFAVINALNSDNIEGYYLLTDGSESLDHFIIDKDTGMELFLALGFKLIF